MVIVDMYKTVVIFFLILALTACSSNDKKESDVFKIVSQADKAYTESRWLEASQLYQTVIEMVPNDHYAWFRLGNVQVRQGRIDSAVYSYKQALNRDATHAKTSYNLGIAYMIIALKYMRNASANVRRSDPANILIQNKVKSLEKLIDQPIEASGAY